MLPQGFRELPKQSTVTYVLCDALVRFTTSRPSNRYWLAALPARVSNLGRLQPASVLAVQAQQSSFSEEKFSHEISDFAPLIPDCGTQSGRLTRSTSFHSRSTFFPVRERESSSRTKQNQCEQRKKNRYQPSLARLKSVVVKCDTQSPVESAVRPPPSIGAFFLVFPVHKKPSKLPEWPHTPLSSTSSCTMSETPKRGKFAAPTLTVDERWPTWGHL